MTPEQRFRGLTVLFLALHSRPETLRLGPEATDRLPHCRVVVQGKCSQVSAPIIIYRDHPGQGECWERGRVHGAPIDKTDDKEMGNG